MFWPVSSSGPFFSAAAAPALNASAKFSPVAMNIVSAVLKYFLEMAAAVEYRFVPAMRCGRPPMFARMSYAIWFDTAAVPPRMMMLFPGPSSVGVVMCNVPGLNQLVSGHW